MPDRAHLVGWQLPMTLFNPINSGGWLVDPSSQSSDRFQIDCIRIFWYSLNFIQETK